MPAPPRRTLLLIYESDSAQHVRVVRQLAQLLRSRCNFTVVSEMTRHEQIRRSRADFVLDAFTHADVVLVVVSEDLRAAWRAQRSDNRSTPGRCAPSVGELLLEQLRHEVVLRPGTVRRVAARFDYTPAGPGHVDTDLALVRTVYELPRDVHRLLQSLRGVDRSTQMLNLACCLSLAPDDDDVTELEQSVAVARQHHQQRQVPAASDVIEATAGSVSATRPLNNTTAPPLNVGHLQSNVTSGYVSALTGELRSIDGRRGRSPAMPSFHGGRYSSPAAVEDSLSVTSALLGSQYPSVASLDSSDIDQRVSLMNGEYDQLSGRVHSRYSVTAAATVEL